MNNKEILLTPIKKNVSNWDIKLNDKNGLKYFTIKNIYSPKEEDIFLKFFSSIKNQLLSPEGSGTATTEGVALKENKAVYCNELPSYPKIIGDIEKKLSIYADKFFELTEKKENDMYSLLPTHINQVNSLISYYNKDNNNYKPHRDGSIFTFLAWYNEGETNFSGGEFCLPEYNITIKCVNNTGVLFPGRVLHEVKPVKILDPSKNKGRITISTFLALNLKHPSESVYN